LENAKTASPERKTGNMKMGNWSRRIECGWEIRDEYRIMETLDGSGEMEGAGSGA
jgi:hypothetical protein